MRQLFLPPGKGVLLKNAKEEKGNYVDYEKEPERLSGAEQPRDPGHWADLGQCPSTRRRVNRRVSVED